MENHLPRCTILYDRNLRLEIVMTGKLPRAVLTLESYLRLQITNLILSRIQLTAYVLGSHY